MRVQKLPSDVLRIFMTETILVSWGFLIEKRFLPAPGTDGRRPAGQRAFSRMVPREGGLGYGVVGAVVVSR